MSDEKIGWNSSVWTTSGGGGSRDGSTPGVAWIPKELSKAYAAIDALKLDAETWSARAMEAEHKLAQLQLIYEGLRESTLDGQSHEAAMEAENAVLLDVIAEREREIRALVGAIRRDEDEIHRLRAISPPTRITREWSKP